MTCLQVALKSDLWNPLLGFIKHLTSQPFVKEGPNHATLQCVLTVLESEKYVPAEIQNAVASIQEISSSRTDSGLAAIVIGLSQGKALLRQARQYAESLVQGMEFLEKLKGWCAKASVDDIPQEKVDDWKEFSKVINEGTSELIAVLAQNQSSSTESADAVKGVISQSKKQLGDFAIAVCKSHVQFTANNWVSGMLSHWTSKDPFASCPPLKLFAAASSKYSVLGNGVSEILNLVSDLDTALGLAHTSWSKSVDGSLDTDSAINWSREFQKFLEVSGERLVECKVMATEMLKSMSELSKSMLALSDSRVVQTSSLHFKTLGDIMAKAR